MLVIKCCTCKTEKPDTEFGKDRSRQTGFSARCIACCAVSRDKLRAKDYYKRYAKRNKTRIRRYRNEKRTEKQQLIRDLKSKPCADCGNTFHYCQMDFDHRRPNSKFKEISKLANTACSVTALLTEVEKCDLVCANCHRLREFYIGPLRRILY